MTTMINSERSRVEIPLCPICQAVLSRKNGLAVSIKYSPGGWGYSKTLMSIGRFLTRRVLRNYKHEYETNVYSEEICDECYEAIVPHLEAANSVYRERLGISRPESVKL